MGGPAETRRLEGDLPREPVEAIRAALARDGVVVVRAAGEAGLHAISGRGKAAWPASHTIALVFGAGGRAAVGVAGQHAAGGHGKLVWHVDHTLASVFGHGGRAADRDAPGAAFRAVGHAADDGGVHDEVVGAHEGERGAPAVGLVKEFPCAREGRLCDGGSRCAAAEIGWRRDDLN